MASSMSLARYSPREIGDVLEGSATIPGLDAAQFRLLSSLPRRLVEAEITALAQVHRVSPDLIRAVITTESNWNARAVSHAGAIGLMQLMPSTAASLGVDPWHPIDNLRGGITYLGALLRAYREDARLALIAYHAGPTHANRVRDGSATANLTTLRYLSAIAVNYPLP